MNLITATTTTTTLHDTLVYFLHRQHQTINHLKQIHSFVITYGLSKDTFLLNKLLHCFLTLSHHSNHALLLFNQIEKTNIKLWNTIIRGFSTSSHQSHMSIALYAKMHRQNGVVPDKHTFPLLLKAFSKSRNQNPFQFYAHIVKYGFDSDDFVRNSLISAFSNCGYVNFARRLFDDSTQRDVVAWTAMIDGYVKNGCAVDGLRCFMEMRSVGVRVDAMTIVGVLVAAGMVGDVWFGRLVHGFYIERGRVRFDVYVGSVLIDMYSKCGCSDDARKIFNEMPIRNVVSWSTLIAGYVQCNRFMDALNVFKDMLADGVKPNQSTLTSVLTACAQVGALDQGRWIHGYIDRLKLDMNLILGTTLIDMYSKCGCIEEALMVFEKLPEKDVYPWTAMINGLAMHGDVLSCLNVYSSMLRSGVQPNEVTFIGVLSACAHGGLVDEGCKLFKSMRDDHNLEPNVDHYGCMVDLLGRAGYLVEARKLIEDMPMEPSPGVWGALLAACMIHNAFELGEHIGKHLIKLQPNHSGRYALLANLYSKSERWDGDAQVRKIMKRKGVDKTPGCSWIQVNGAVSEFISHDTSHSKLTNHIYEMLNYINVELKLIGNVSDRDFLAFDLDVV
ncbi:hypothetical protein Dsin_000253 [Dipteronia sinensis]|uniref:Uncharacterized protein n=1 Tax=Dipteronia sinensis TaxID=43782 RepID=A0AAE0B2W3_9ROSI|nr:hypothetical protein Dsin_000253 [Dipteronia sinensis]